MLAVLWSSRPLESLSLIGMLTREQPVGGHVVASTHDVHSRLQYDVEGYEHEDDCICEASQHTNPACAVYSNWRKSAIFTWLTAAASEVDQYDTRFEIWPFK